MRILHVTWYDYHDDYSYQENILSKKHRELGHEVYLVTTQFYYDRFHKAAMYKPREYVNKDGINVCILPVRQPFFIFRWFVPVCVGLFEKINQISPDIIFVHNFAFRDVSSIVKYADAHPDVKIYADNHSDYLNQPTTGLKGHFKVWNKKKNAQKLYRVLSCCWGTLPWRVKYLSDVYKLSPEKLDFLVMGADEQYIVGKDRTVVRSTIRQQYGIPDDSFLVVTGGKIDKRKKQDLLFDAVSRLNDKNVWLIVFGMPDNEMKPIVDDYKKYPNLVFAGWASQEQQYDFMLASDLAVFPGSHSVLWEIAVACSLPAVFKHWEGIEHIKIGNNAILLDDVSSDTLSSTIVQLLENPDRYLAMKAQTEKITKYFYGIEMARKSISK